MVHDSWDVLYVAGLIIHVNEVIENVNLDLNIVLWKVHKQNVYLGQAELINYHAFWFL